MMTKLNLAHPLQEYQQPAPERRFRLICGGLAHYKLEPEDLKHESGQTIDKKIQFRTWLALFFIERGKYKITDKGYAELAPDIERQDTHFGEHDSARERSTKREITRPLTKSEIKEAVNSKVGQMLREGKAEELYNNKLIDRSYHIAWSNKQIRVTVIKKLLEFLGASPTRLDELREELDQLILQSAREEKTDAKRMQEVLDEIRRNLGRIRRVSGDDFNNNRLSGLMNHYKNSPYLALVEAGYAYPEDEIKEQNGQFKTDKIYPWEIKNAPLIYSDKEIRIAACKWLVWKLKKDPKDIIQDDFNNNGLGGLVGNYYKGSPYDALLEAGLVTQANEAYMRSSQHTH